MWIPEIENINSYKVAGFPLDIGRRRWKEDIIEQVDGNKWLWGKSFRLDEAHVTCAIFMWNKIENLKYENSQSLCNRL